MAGTERRRCFPDASSFRDWLRANQATAKVLWLVFHKKHAGRKGISYEEAVRQALCYGWIDSIIKRLDDDRCLRKFTPRKDKSKWSRSNIERAIKLIEGGEMTEAGYAVLPARSVGALRKLDVPERPDFRRTPPFILERLRKSTKALEFFISLPPSHRRNYADWIMEAKKEETRIRRLERAVGFLARHQKPML